MAEWSARQNCNPAVPGSTPVLATTRICFTVSSSEFKSSATLVNNQLVCLCPVRILSIVKNLKYLFQLFAEPTSLCAINAAEGKQEDLLDLITALLKFNCFLSTTVATQCIFQSNL